MSDTRQPTAEERKTIDQIKMHWEQAKQYRRLWEPTWEEITDYIAPRKQRDGFLNDTSVGQRKGSAIYDGSAPKELLLAVDAFQGHMVSDHFRWFTLYHPKQEINEHPIFRKWVQDVEDQMYSEFQASNFYEAINEYLYDGMSLGTAHIFAEDVVVEEKIRFIPVHPYETYIDENWYGKVDTHFRHFQMSARNALDRFGMYFPELRKMVEDTPYKMITFLHHVRPRQFWDSRTIDPKRARFESVYIDLDRGLIAEESGWNLDRYASWRYRKNTNEIYGRSPSYEALRDTKVLNELSKAMLTVAQKHVNPPLFLPEQFAEQGVNRLPGGLNFYNAASGPVQPFIDTGRYEIALDREEQKRQALKEHYRTEYFLMLAQIDKTMTATEIIERQNEKVALLSGTIGRFANESLNPIIDIVFDVAFRAGRIPEPPEVVLELTQGRLDVDYIGPLAQAQKRLKAQGSLNAANALLPFAEYSQEVVATIKWPEFSKEIAEAFGMRATSMRTPEEVAEIMTAIQEREEAMAQAERATKMATSPNMVKQPEEKSILGKMFAGEL